jgi:hypothetical protein
VAWFNVDTFFSDKLYVRESRSAGVRRRVITLDAGNYTSVTLPVALAEKLNAGKSFPTMSYAVNYVGARGCLLIQLVTISGQAADSSARFQLPSEDELLSASWRAANWTGTTDSFDAADLDDKHKITFTEFATLAVLMSSTDEKDADAQVSLFLSRARVCLSRDCAG